MIYFLFLASMIHHTLWFPSHSPLRILLPDAVREPRAQSSLSARSPSGICLAPGFKYLWTLDSDFYLWPSPHPRAAYLHFQWPPWHLHLCIQFELPTCPPPHTWSLREVLPTSLRVSLSLPVAQVRNFGVILVSPFFLLQPYLIHQRKVLALFFDDYTESGHIFPSLLLPPWSRPPLFLSEFL